MAIQLYTLKHEQVEPVPIETEPQLLEVKSRIDRLKKIDLNPFEIELLNLLERPVAFTPTELKCLAMIEQWHSDSL